MPAASIEPQAAGQAVPERLHWTAMSGLPALVSVAEKCRFAPSSTFAVDGETAMEMSLASVSCAEADFDVSAWLFAVICITAEEGRLGGAVYMPWASIVPSVELPPGTLLTSQVTAVFEVPVTLAVNCWVRPRSTLALAGATETEMEGGGGGGGATGPTPPPPQPSVHAPAVRRGNKTMLENLWKRVGRRGNTIARPCRRETSEEAEREGGCCEVQTGRRNADANVSKRLQNLTLGEEGAGITVGKGSMRGVPVRSRKDVRLF